MLNKIWFWLLCIGIVYGFCKAGYQSSFPPKAGAASSELATSPTKPPSVEVGPASEGAIVDAIRSFFGIAPEHRAKPTERGFTAMGKRLNGALLDAAKTSIEICIGLIGIMALWLGLLNIAKDAGLINAFARLMRPFMRWLFPEVPDGHPAQGAMLMNFSANMLGLDNAATPMGLKAMEELQTLNPVKDTATNSMALFLAINCGSITLIPFTIIGFRALRGSHDPAGIIGGTLLASMASVVAGVTAARLLARSSKGQVDSVALPDSTPLDGASAGSAGGH
jgi:spore maturation protein SpmA